MFAQVLDHLTLPVGQWQASTGDIIHHSLHFPTTEYRHSYAVRLNRVPIIEELLVSFYMKLSARVRIVE